MTQVCAEAPLRTRRDALGCECDFDAKASMRPLTVAALSDGTVKAESSRR